MYGFHVSIEEALIQFGEVGREALKKELIHMVTKDVFDPVPYSDITPNILTKALPSLAFLKEKYKPDGSFDKCKARLVAGGHVQDDMLYQDKSSPTIDTTHLFIEAVLAHQKRMVVTTLDVGSAFLNAEMTGETVYMKLNKSLSKIMIELFPSYQAFKNPTTNQIVVRLKKALYGCIQSSLLWYRHLRKTLENYGLIVNFYDECVFSMSNEHEELTVLVYVDDLMILSSSETVSSNFVEYMRSKYNEIQVTNGHTHSYLGMTFNFAESSLHITMNGYIQKLMNQHHIKGYSNSPASSDLFDITSDTTVVNEKLQSKIHTAVAQLLFLATRVRPDILLVVNFLSTRVNKFTQSDYKKLLKCMKYLNATRELGLKLKLIRPDDQSIRQFTYADASFGVHKDGKSQTGIMTTLGNGSINSVTQKQKITTKSSSEAELVAASDAASVSLSIKNYLKSRNYNVVDCILGQDNQSTKSVIEKGPKASRRMRHLDIRYFFIQDYVQKKELSIEYVNTSQMLADILTKPVQGELFRNLRDQLMGHIPEAT
jgi:hypothetical protein